MSLTNIIKTYWTKYLQIGVYEGQEDYLKRQIFLSNRYTSFVSSIALGFLVYNLVSQNYNRVVGNILEVLIVQSVPLMNHLRWSRVSRYVLCLTPLLATVLSRIGQTSFGYLEYGIMSYVGLFSSIAPLVFFNYSKEKKSFWTLALINLVFLGGYNFYLKFLSGESMDTFWTHPYTLLKVPELLLWLGIVVGVMIFKSVVEKAEEKERMARMQLEKANDEVNHLMNQLNKQNKLLKNHNKEIEETNTVLEEKVQERTKVLEERNAQLYDYAFMNSHLLRAPISKLQGLITLLNSDVNEIQKAQIFAYVEESVKELDKVVFEINDKVKDNNERSTG